MECEFQLHCHGSARNGRSPHTGPEHCATRDEALAHPELRLLVPLRPAFLETASRLHQTWSRKLSPAKKSFRWRSPGIESHPVSRGRCGPSSNRVVSDPLAQDRAFACAYDCI